MRCAWCALKPCKGFKLLPSRKPPRTFRESSETFCELVRIRVPSPCKTSILVATSSKIDHARRSWSPLMGPISGTATVFVHVSSSVSEVLFGLGWGGFSVQKDDFTQLLREISDLGPSRKSTALRKPLSLSQGTLGKRPEFRRGASKRRDSVWAGGVCLNPFEINLSSFVGLDIYPFDCAVAAGRAWPSAVGLRQLMPLCQPTIIRKGNRMFECEML